MVYFLSRLKMRVGDVYDVRAQENTLCVISELFCLFYGWDLENEGEIFIQQCFQEIK